MTGPTSYERSACRGVGRPPVPALGTSNAGRMLGVLGLFGLLGLLGLLLAGLTETVRPRTE